MANARGVKFADLLRHLGGSADGPVALGGRAHVHAIADAQRLGCFVQRLLVAVADAREHEVRRPEAVKLAAGLLRGGLDGRKPVGEHLWANGVGEPAVGEPSGTTQRRLGAAAEPDRWSTRLAWRGRHLHVRKLVEAAIMAHRLARPQLAYHLDGFSQPRPALADGYTASLVFLGKLPADADAKDEPSIRQVIEGGDLLGDGRGMAQRQQEDGGAQGQPRADGGGLGDLRERVEDWDGEGDVVAAPK